MPSAGSDPSAASMAGTPDRRTLILASAARLFASKGYAGTTIRDIARLADLTSGSLYHHFVSKDEMLAEILHAFLDGLVARFERVEQQSDDPEETLRGLFQDAFSTIHETPDAVALYQHEAPGLAGRPEFAFVAESTRRLELVIRRTVEAGQVQGAFREDLDIGLTYRFIRDTVWIAVHWYRPDGPATPVELGERYLRVVLHGITVDR